MRDPDSPTPTPLLLVHGFPLEPPMWDHTVAAFSGRRGVWAPRLSALAEGITAPLTMGGFARAVANAAPWPRFVVVGLSMGGYIALEMWKAVPERLAGLVLADTRAEADAPDARLNRETMLRSVDSDGVLAATSGLRDRLVATCGAEGVRAALREMMVGQDSGFVKDCIRALRARPDNVATLATIDVPTLVVVGEEDAVTPVEDARRIANAVSHSRLEVIPGAGHMTPMEAPEAFNAALDRWLADEKL